MSYSSHRLRLLEWIRSQLAGPADGGEFGGELNGVSPLDRYPTGVLYPLSHGDDGIDPASEEIENEADPAASGEETSTEDADPIARRRRYVPPSSMGFSFFVRGAKIAFQVLVSATVYESEDERRDERGRYLAERWNRVTLKPDPVLDRPFTPPPGQDGVAHGEAFRERIEVFGDKTGIDLFWRPFLDGWLVTATLFNRMKEESEGNPSHLWREKNRRSLFEVRLECVFHSGEVGDYPRIDPGLLSEEEREIELQYKHRRIFAVGHGTAVTWEMGEGERTERVASIRSEFLPTVEVPQVTAESGEDDGKTLRLVFLKDIAEHKAEVIAALGRFTARYGEWIGRNKADAALLQGHERETAGRITARMEEAVRRMNAGILLLEHDRLAMRAFALANRAMLDQMRRSDRAGNPDSKYRWRPFQLAFLLCILESAVNEESEFRDTVDLIWFPTGGGKTEAYLGLIAFLVAYRRMRYPDKGGGTTVLMRYTLRLLTGQQYLRAAKLICALELIRRAEGDLGAEPITIGMWVGQASSPNTVDQARESVERAGKADDRPPMNLVFDACPWCGTPFRAGTNYRFAAGEFRIVCRKPECAFGGTGDGVLPCNVVDEMLYRHPPTLLIATIDKFARLAWEERTNAFFGVNGNRPPELVIQDELHLIAGALGSIAGLYEAGLEVVLNRKRVPPKYIASTATIHMADRQVRRLYGREVAVFPPPGLTCDDSYFARTVPTSERPGRLYIGYLTPLLDQRICLAPLAAALLVAPEWLSEGQVDRDRLADAWWTQVVYHGSLKGVGNSHNVFETEVRDLYARTAEEIRQTIRRRLSEGFAEAGEPDMPVLSRSRALVKQLTSLAKAGTNAETFGLLERPRGREGCIDAVLATNMISVGLDVGRLALMVVNGQPLTTAEYIQASSRVGRDAVPGIVFVNYYRHQARSLSHYENFRPYHESFYRFVEPTSITPFTFQARKRALHAALVIAVRHACPGMAGNDSAGRFDPREDRIAEAIAELKRRCRKADAARYEETARHIDLLVSDWEGSVQDSRSRKRLFCYSAQNNDTSNDGLLRNHDEKGHGRWATLQSMRNVEPSALLEAT